VSSLDNADEPLAWTALYLLIIKMLLMSTFYWWPMDRVVTK